MTAAAAADLTASAWARWRQWAMWNVKKVAKTVGGRLYAELRLALLARSQRAEKSAAPTTDTASR
jgi:hypothetical protein